MSIRVQNFSVINDSRQLSNITSATLSGLGVINANTTDSPALTIEQQGTGNCLSVRDQLTDSSPVVINADGKMIIGGLSAPTHNNGQSETPDITLDAASTGMSELSLKTGSVLVNGVNGWSFQYQIGRLHIVKQTSTDFTTNEKVITFGTDNRVGILTDSPLASLDVRGNMGIHTDNSGFVFSPKLVSVSVHGLVSTNTDVASYKTLDFFASDFRLYTGAFNSGTISRRFTMTSDGVGTFSTGTTTVGGTLNGVGIDWVLLSTTNVSTGVNQIDFALSGGENFLDYVVVIENATLSVLSRLVLKLLGAGDVDLSASSYRYSLFSGVSFAAGSLSEQIPGGAAGTSAFWPLSVANIYNVADSGLSAQIFIYDPKSSNANKMFSIHSTHRGFISSTDCQANCFGAGDVAAVAAAEKLRFFSGGGQITGGRFSLYGLRRT